MSETNFTKLFSSITASTIWCESPETKIVWITMLAMADENGWVYASVPGLANIAQIPINKTRVALDKFLSPDSDSRDSDNEGRRIESIDGGWAILNHPKYRKLRNKEERRAYQREYMRNRRSGKSVNNPVNKCKQSKPPCTKAEAEAEAEGTKKTATFVAPSIKQVTKYKLEKNLSIDPSQFIDFYESKGWIVGKVKMKDWKAAARGWSTRESNGSNKSLHESTHSAVMRRLAERMRDE